MVRVQVRRVARQGPPAHLEALVVEAGLLEEEAKHRLVLRLARIRGETSARNVDAPAVVALRDAVQPREAHGDAVARIVGGDPSEGIVGRHLFAALHRRDGAQVQALALVARVVGEGQRRASAAVARSARPIRDVM